MEADHTKHLGELVAHNTANPEQKKSVHIRYHKLSTNRHVKREVSPISLNGNHLVAFDHKRKAIRSFKTDRIKSMEKTAAFWSGFEKRANAAAELAGLGMLAVPSVQSLRGKPVSERTKDSLEVAGLGTLAAPYLKPAYTTGKAKATSLAAKMKPHFQGIGRFISRVA